MVRAILLSLFERLIAFLVLVALLFGFAHVSKGFGGWDGETELAAPGEFAAASPDGRDEDDDHDDEDDKERGHEKNEKKPSNGNKGKRGRD